MENESNKRIDSVFSTKVRAGKRRTYFFDVRQTKGNDYYITLTESTKRYNGDGYERHKLFLYKEDFNRFIDSLQETIDYVKTELLPEYDYDEFTRRQEEWEEKRAAEDAENHQENKTVSQAGDENTEEDTGAGKDAADEDGGEEAGVENSLDGGDDDISW